MWSSGVETLRSLSDKKISWCGFHVNACLVLEVQCMYCGTSFKGDPKQRHITGPVHRNGIKTATKKTLSSFSVCLWAALLKISVWRSWKHGRERCRFVFGSLYLWCFELGQHVWQKWLCIKKSVCVCYNVSQPISALHWQRVNRHGRA